VNPVPLRPLFAVAAALLLLSGCEGPSAPVVQPSSTRPATSLARLKNLKGAVILERDGRARPAAEEALRAGDAVETRQDAEAELHFPDGRVLEVGPDARLVLAANDVVEVERGFVLSRVPAEPAFVASPGGARPAEVALSILTPFGLTRVGAGQSEISFQVGGDQARVDVLVGRVELLGADGSSTRVGAGEAVSLQQGEVQILSRGAPPPRDEAPALRPLAFAIAGDATDVRRAGGKAWQAVPKKGAALANGDAVRVRRGKSTLSMGEGTALGLGAGAELLLARGGRDGDTEEAHLEVKKGQLELDLARGQKTRLVLGELVLESDHGGFFSLSRVGDGYELAAMTGALRVRRGDAEQRLVAGQVAKLGGKDEGTAEVRRAERPELVLPSRSAQRVFHPGLGHATLSWRGEPAEYRVRVAEDPRFERVVLEGRVFESQLAVPIPRRGALYWEVKDTAGADVDSGSALFAPEPQQGDLERVRNEVPEGPEKTTIYYQDKPPAVTFTYAAEEGAARYKVAVFRVGQLDRPVVERTVTQVAAATEAGLLAEGSYVWSVTPLSGEGEALRGGRMNKLDLVYDNSVPTLLVRAPQNNDPAGRELRTFGAAPVGTRLFVNGRAVELDDKSRFDAQVSPQGSPPQVIYRVVRPNAPDAYYVRVLRRSRG
jgi:hypothetical protein